MERASSRLGVNLPALAWRAASAVALLCVLLFALSWSWMRHDVPLVGASRGELRVWFFDIGQGDATLIEAPDGQQLLVDGGSDDAVLAKLGTVLSPTDRSLDGILLTHPDADHVGGLPAVLERYDVASVYETGARKDTAVFERFARGRDAEGAARVLLSVGDRIVMGDVILEVLSPQETQEGRVLKDPNHASIVLLLRYGDTTLILPGDATADEERVYGALAGDVDVLHVGHHGSNTSSELGFLKAVRPETVVISVGADNRYGHPHPAVLERFSTLRIPLLRTDLDGDILLTSQGGEPTIRAAPLPF